jgi:glycosyltransferase involved in cell wall biosynthesis
MPPLPVTYDIGPAVHQGAGLAKYAERLAAHLLAGQGAAVDLTLFYNAHSGHRPPSSLAAAPTRTLPLSQLAWRLSVLASQLARIPYFRGEGRGTRGAHFTLHNSQFIMHNSLYHATEHLLPYLPAAPTVLTVHDLIFERYPQHHTWRNRLYLRAAMPRYVHAATAIIAVSQQTKADLVELYGAPAEKIHVVYEGIAAEFAPASAAEMVRVRTHYSPDRPYLLMVGTLEPRKHHAAALHALARLKAQALPHRLLVVGGHGWRFAPIQQLVADLGLTGDVTFTGYVPPADLPPLYTGADCVLLPSLYEGFGFPVLEAMACAAPVVCSNVSSLPEVAGAAALLVSPNDDQALADAVALILSQPALAAALRRRGLQQAAGFRWETCAAETVAVYQWAWRKQPR